MGRKIPSGKVLESLKSNLKRWRTKRKVHLLVRPTFGKEPFRLPGRLKTGVPRGRGKLPANKIAPKAKRTGAKTDISAMQAGNPTQLRASSLRAAPQAGTYLHSAGENFNLLSLQPALDLHPICFVHQAAYLSSNLSHDLHPYVTSAYRNCFNRQTPTFRHETGQADRAESNGVCILGVILVTDQSRASRLSQALALSFQPYPFKTKVGS